MAIVFYPIWPTVNALKQKMRTVPAVTVVFSELVLEVLYCLKITTILLALGKPRLHSKTDGVF